MMMTWKNTVARKTYTVTSVSNIFKRGKSNRAEVEDRFKSNVNTTINIKVISSDTPHVRTDQRKIFSFLFWTITHKHHKQGPGLGLT
jgi:hypothetical protein